MTLYKPGYGKGRAMHQQRVRGFQVLEEIGLATFHRYVSGEGYVLTTGAGDERTIASAEGPAYLIGCLDLYSALRRAVDEVAGEDVLNTLDERFLDALSRAADPFLEDNDGGQA